MSADERFVLSTITPANLDNVTTFLLFLASAGAESRLREGLAEEGGALRADGATGEGAGRLPEGSGARPQADGGRAGLRGEFGARRGRQIHPSRFLLASELESNSV